MKLVNMENKNLIQLIFICLCLLLTTACATTYTGPHPDFSLKKEQAKSEIQKFSFSEGFFSNGTEVITMGSDNRVYSLNSVRPIISKVSSKADKKINTAKTWERVSHLLFAAALGILIAEVSGPSEESFKNDSEAIYYGLLGGSLVSSFVSSGYIKSAVKTYNHDLERKYLSEDPQSLGFNFSFKY